MIRVLHLITGLGRGGAETMLSRVVSRLDRSRFENMVVTINADDALADEVRAAGVEVVSLGIRRGALDLRAVKRLARIVRLYRPRIMQTWLYHADLLGLIVARLCAVPVLVWNLRCSNMEMRHYSAVSAVTLRVLAMLSRQPDAVIVNSIEGRRIHEALGYRARRWSPIPNGFDLDKFLPDSELRRKTRSGLGIGADEIVAGMLARFDPMKDHATFLAAAAIASKRHAKLRFALAGKGCEPSNAALAALIERYQLSGKILLLGERCDAPAVLNAFDIEACSSSFGEGFPNAVAEAMACGVPCVATRVGDAELIIGNTGRIVPPRDPIAFAGALSELVEAGSTGRTRMGTAARERIRTKFALKHVTAMYQNLYFELLAERLLNVHAYGVV